MLGIKGYLRSSCLQQEEGSTHLDRMRAVVPQIMIFYRETVYFVMNEVHFTFQL